MLSHSNRLGYIPIALFLFLVTLDANAQCTTPSQGQVDAFVNVSDDYGWLPGDQSFYPSLSSFSLGLNSIDQEAYDWDGVGDAVYIDYYAGMSGTLSGGQTADLYATVEMVQSNQSPLYSSNGGDVYVGTGPSQCIRTTAYSNGQCNGYIDDIYAIIHTPVSVSVTVNTSQVYVTAGCTSPVTFSVSVNGGSGQYLYSWSDGTTNPTTSVTPGSSAGDVSISVTVHDVGYGCDVSGSNYITVLSADPWKLDTSPVPKMIGNDHQAYTNHNAVTDTWTSFGAHVAVTVSDNWSWTAGGGAQVDIPPLLTQVGVNFSTSHGWGLSYTITGDISYNAANGPIPVGGTVDLYAQAFSSPQTGLVEQYGCDATAYNVGSYTVNNQYSTPVSETRSW